MDCVLIYHSLQFEMRTPTCVSWELHIFSSLFWCLQMLMKAVYVDVCASSSSSSSPFIPLVLTFTPYEALGSHVSCYRQAVHLTLGGKCSLPGPVGIVNYITILIY